MKLEEFTYNLPDERIAKFPPKRRGSTKLLVLDSETGDIEHKKYIDITNYVKEGDVVVLNETKVLKVRTYFLTSKGRKVEVLFLNHEEDKIWFVLIGGGRYVTNGEILTSLVDENIKITVLERKERGFLVSIQSDIDMNEFFSNIGHTPLPPYIKREDTPEDETRYNTVFSKIPGSSAAPTASLNLTEEMINTFKKKGVIIAPVELKVGWGTFAPIRVQNIKDHKMHGEYINIPTQTAEIINKAKSEGHSIWAFGTTVVRALESAAVSTGIKNFSGETNLYIYPGFEFKVVDHLITNFHQPDSSLILMVSAFAGIDNIKKAYSTALDMDYKFLSYGDSMLVI